MKHIWKGPTLIKLIRPQPVSYGSPGNQLRSVQPASHLPHDEVTAFLVCVSTQMPADSLGAAPSICAVQGVRRWS